MCVCICIRYVDVYAYVCLNVSVVSMYVCAYV